MIRLHSFTLDDVKWLPRSRLEFCLVDGVSRTTLHGLALFYRRASGSVTAFILIVNHGDFFHNNTVYCARIHASVYHKVLKLVAKDIFPKTKGKNGFQYEI